MRPAERAAILSSSLSTQMTSLPRSAKTAPVSSPTYPVPATQMFIRTGGENYSRADGRGQGKVRGAARGGRRRRAADGCGRALGAGLRRSIDPGLVRLRARERLA